MAGGGRVVGGGWQGGQGTRDGDKVQAYSLVKDLDLGGDLDLVRSSPGRERLKLARAYHKDSQCFFSSLKPNRCGQVR